MEMLHVYIYRLYNNNKHLDFITKLAPRWNSKYRSLAYLEYS